MSLPANIRRCDHIRTNGVRCGSPALRDKQFCYYHHRVRQPRHGYSIPLLEDANGIQMGIQEVLHALADNTIDVSTAKVMLYGLQVAAVNAKLTQFEPYASNVVTDAAMLDVIGRRIMERLSNLERKPPAAASTEDSASAGEKQTLSAG